MINKARDVSIKNNTYYIFDDFMNIKNFGSNNKEIDEKSCKYILMYYIGYVTIKDSKYVKINSVKVSSFNQMSGIDVMIYQ